MTNGKTFWRESTTSKCKFCHLPYKELVFQAGEVEVIANASPQCECEKKYNYLTERVSQSIIRPMYKKMDLKSFNGSLQPKAYNKTASYIKNLSRNIKEGHGLVYYGPIGTGKTHLAAAIVNEAIKKYYFCIVQSVPEIFFNIRQRNFQSVNALIDCDLLVLDDFGRERATDFVKETLFTVINARYEKLLPIIITTNMGPKTLKVNLGDAVISRIYQMCDIIEMDNTGDYRENQKKQQKHRV